MLKRSKIIAVVLTAVFLSGPAYATGRRRDAMPAPKLLAPLDKVDLTGKDKLEFRWASAGAGSFDHYDFRLYKGTETYDKDRILKKEVSARETALSLDASTFEAGQTYAWSLRAVGMQKGDSAYSLFTVKR